MSIKMYFSFVHFLLTIILSVGIMIKLFKVKEKQKELAENANGKPPGKKQSAGELRLHKGFHFFFFFFLLIWTGRRMGSLSSIQEKNNGTSKSSS